MLKALKRSARNAKAFSCHTVKLLLRLMSMFWKLGARSEPGRTVPKLSLGCWAKVHFPSSWLGPHEVPCTAVPQYALFERLTTFNGRSWLGLAAPVNAFTRLE